MARDITTSWRNLVDARAHYFALVFGDAQWSASWKQRDLVRGTRKFLSSLLKDPKLLDSAARPEDEHHLIAWSFLRDVPGGLGAALTTNKLPRHIEPRIELCKIISRSNLTQSVRRTQAVDHIIENMDYFVGWDYLCLTSEEYQLQEPAPWWHPSGSFFQYEEMRKSLTTSRQLIEAGFIQLDREAYLQRVREPVIFNLIQKGDYLKRIVTFLALYSAPARKLTKDGAAWVEHTLDDIRRELARELTRRDFTAVPMKPLYSLPRESNNIRQFFITKESNLTVDATKQIARSGLPRACAKFIDDPAGQQALFFDTHLVNKASGEADSFVSVKLETPQTNVLGALTQAIEQLNVDAAVFEHLPRIVAGMFAAAHRDRMLFGTAPGTFWDTQSGKRLCKIVGFNPENYKHRQRIQHVCKLLESLILHRSTSNFDDKGRKITIKHRGPLVELRQAEIELQIENREGLSEKHTFQSWSIDDALWQMTLFKEQGGAPAFMMLDDRAFKLDERSSVAFNIYWTLVNRAYNDRVAGTGDFELNLWTLYDWSGLEQTSPRVDRLKDAFNSALDRMVEIGLLVDWRCEPLRRKGSTTMESLRQARLGVTFAQTQLRMLPKIA